VLEKIRSSLRAFPAFGDLRVAEDDFQTAAVALLKGHVFHATGAHSLPQIVASNAILPNLERRFRSPFSQSDNSYGVKRGYICLFDFREHNEPFIESAFECFLWGAVKKYAHRPTFLIIDPSLHPNLIDSQTAQRETGGKEVWVPHVECWHAAAIPVNAIASATVMRVERRPFDGSFAAQHARSVERFWKKHRRETGRLRPVGLAAGEFVVPDDFDDPLPDEILDAFEGDED
jgi:hypothetical protein